MENLTLKGTVQQQAKQLWDILNEREISSETLQIIMPNVAGFYKELVSCINRETVSNDEITKSVIDTYNQQLLILTEGLTKQEISSEDKKIIADLISETNARLHAIQKDKSDKSHNTKLGWLGVASFLGVALLALVSKKSKC